MDSCDPIDRPPSGSFPEATSSQVLARLMLVPLPLALVGASFLILPSVLFLLGMSGVIQHALYQVLLLPGIAACVFIARITYGNTWKQLPLELRKKVLRQIALLAIVFSITLVAVPGLIFLAISGSASSYDYATPLLGMGLALLVIPLVPYLTAILAYWILLNGCRSQGRFFISGSVLLGAWLGQFVFLGLGSFAMGSYSSFLRNVSGGSPCCLAVSPDNVHCATANSFGEITIQRIHFPHLGKTWRADQPGIRALAYSPDGKLLASGGDDHVINIWDVTSHSRVLSLSVASFPLAGMARSRSNYQDIPKKLVFSPRGDMLLADCSGGQALFLWDLATGQPVRPLVWPVGASGFDLVTAAFSHDGTGLFSGHQDGVVRQWNVSTGSLTREFRPPEPGMGAAICIAPWDANSILISYSNKGLCSWDISKGAIVREMERRDGTMFLVQSKNLIIFENLIRYSIFAYPSGSHIGTRELGLKEEIHAAGVTANGDCLVLLQGGKLNSVALNKAP